MDNYFTMELLERMRYSVGESWMYVFRRYIQTIQVFDPAIQYDAEEKQYILSKAVRDSGETAGVMVQGVFTYLSDCCGCTGICLLRGD